MRRTERAADTLREEIAQIADTNLRIRGEHGKRYRRAYGTDMRTAKVRDDRIAVRTKEHKGGVAGVASCRHRTFGNNLDSR